MPFELLNPDGLVRPANYSQVGAVSGGRLVFVAGQLGLDATGALVGEDFASQARQAFGNVATALEAAGARPSDVVKLAIYVVATDPDRLRLARDARVAVFGTHLPTSLYLGVEALAMPEYLIEVEAVAVVG
ncbi:MAG TPA: RidA family protein [Candidatus Limnocylindrales bacterium]